MAHVSDPKQWSEDHVRQWLMWAIKDFSLEGVSVHEFQMKGRDLVGMGRDSFLNRTPPFMGDILWQHLEFLQKGEYIALCWGVSGECKPVPSMERVSIQSFSSRRQVGEADNYFLSS